MSLLDEYRRQYRWRDWTRALSLCPAFPGQQVLDLGCGPGDLSIALSARGLSVTGIDNDSELLEAAKVRCPECRFEKRDLRFLELVPATFDAIWCSFTAAYFTNFGEIFSHWSSLLKTKAWVCIIDIDDLLGHHPLVENTRRKITAFYDEAFAALRYDFRIGRKIESVLKEQGFEVASVTLEDQELSLDGPVSPDVLRAWKSRLARMSGLQTFFGSEFASFENEFVRCLSATYHRALCKVVCCIGVRT